MSETDLRNTPDDTLNALSNLLGDILTDLTVVELYSQLGHPSRRFLNEGASQAVCVAEEFPDGTVKTDGLVRITMNPTDFLEEKRVQNVGLVYSLPPYDSEQNKIVLDKITNSPVIASNCIVILQETTWNHTRIENFGYYAPIETYRFDTIQISVSQLLDEPK